MLLLTVMGCATLQDLLFEVRVDGDEVRLEGWVYASPSPEDAEDVLDGQLASLTLTDPDGELVLDADGAPYVAEEPFPDTYPGYWRFSWPLDTSYQLRIDGGEGHYPAVWQGRSTTGDAFWPRYSVFGWDHELVDSFFEGLIESDGMAIHPLEFGDVAHVWGAPYDPEAVRGDSIVIEGGDGAQAQVYAYSYDDEQGSYIRTSGSPVDFFFAFNLVPGSILVRVIDEESGEDATTRYTAEGGDLIAAWYFQGPS